jgi:hypothetical protein
MEKYENCLDCDLHQIVYGDSYADTDVYCFKEKRYVGKRFGPIKDLARPDWCPIICQLPEGHGRLVDANKLADNMKARKAFFGRMSDPQCLVEDAPTIVPAERSEV